MFNANIVVVGGGTVHPNSPFVKSAIELTGKERPNVLFVPSAVPSSNVFGASQVIALDTFQKQLGLAFRCLHRFGEFPKRPTATRAVEQADLLYLPGGSLQRLMECWERGRYIPLITEAILNGKPILCLGESALALFGTGFSEARRFIVEPTVKWGYEPTAGLCILRAIACTGYDTAHPQTALPRGFEFNRFMRAQLKGTVGIGFDTKAGLKIVGGQATVISEAADAYVYRVVTLGNNNCQAIRLGAGQSLSLDELLH